MKTRFLHTKNTPESPSDLPAFSPRKKHLFRFLILTVAALVVVGVLYSVESYILKENDTDGIFCEEKKEYKTGVQDVFLERKDGTYTYAEMIYPKKYEGAMPLVVIGHGFKGNLNSGGARELSQRLAASGTAAIRMDFNPRVAPDPDAKKTGCYDLNSMKDDMLAAIGYAQGHFEIDAGRIGLYARSMGGRVVMTMANESYGGYNYRALAMVAPAGNETAMIDYAGGHQAWEKLKKQADAVGAISYQGLKLSPEWFREFEEYNPCDYGYQFGNKPVLVICNTLDYVVSPETSKECAAAYENSRVIEVTTNNYHGYEMSYKTSELKNYLMGEIVDFFSANL